MIDLSLLLTAIFRPRSFARWIRARLDRASRDSGMRDLEEGGIYFLAALTICIFIFWLARG